MVSKQTKIEWTKLLERLYLKKGSGQSIQGQCLVSCRSVYGTMETVPFVGPPDRMNADKMRDNFYFLAR